MARSAGFCMCHLARGALVCGLGLQFALVSASRQADAQTATPVEGAEAPRVLQRRDAIYPPDQVASSTRARVVLSVSIDAEGHVAGVDVVESGGAAFDAAAVAAMKEWTFEPALRAG